MKQDKHWIAPHPTVDTRGVFHFMAAKSGGLTCRVESEQGAFWLHSQYDPQREGERTMYAQWSTREEAFSKLIVYGFGCGHHLRALLQEPELEPYAIEVWETNVQFFHDVQQQEDFSDLLQHPRVTLRVTDDLTQIGKWVADWETEQPALVIHDPSLRLIPEALAAFGEAMRSYKVFLNSLASFKDMMRENFVANQSLGKPGIATLIGAFSNVPLILVSAGPSLARHLPLLEQAKQHALIGCVGTALRPVLQSGVRPDFCMIIDPKPLVLEQIEGVQEGQIPLFFLSTAHHGVAAQFPGPVFQVYQAGYEAAEQVALTKGEPLIRSGGSVSTALFDLLLQMGANPICLIGQDLAYTDQQSHVTGAHNVTSFQDVQHRIHVENFWRNGTVPTVKNLMIYRDFLSRRAAEEPQRELFNATEGGAYIEGFEHVTFATFLQKIQEIDVGTARALLQQLVLRTE